jgi:O-antigen/teichoic acid export membrane protein
MTAISATRQEADPTRRKSLPRSSMWLLVGKGSQMGLAFLFWVVAARTASVTDVGIAAASVSAVMLCTQLAILGAGSAVIIEIGRGQEHKSVLDPALTLVGVTALLAGAGYLGVTRLLGSSDLGSTATLRFGLAFLLAALVGTFLICLDQVSLAVDRADGPATRYTLSGVLALAAVLTAAATGQRMSATVLVACWAGGSLAAALLGLVQLRRWVGYRYHPSLRLGGLWRILRLGLPNHVLTLTERLPPILVPIILAHMVSAEMTAYWYPAWMMAWLALTAPVSVGMVQFADLVRRPGDAVAVIRQGVIWSTLLGGALFVVLAAGASLFLALLGEGYADASVTAVRLLALGLLPFILVQAYNAFCRATGHTLEATLVGLFVTVAVCAGTVLVGSAGTSALALVWVVSITTGALAAVVRLRVLLRTGSAAIAGQKVVNG